MKIPSHELWSVLMQFNPWWRGEPIPDLPNWRRAAFKELWTWTQKPPVARAVLLSGARQIGKTTLILQVIQKQIEEGVPSSNILYATFDHPIIKLAGIDAVLQAWQEHMPKKEGAEYLFLDEAQFIREWGTWVKHQVDFLKHRRIIFTGSAMPLLDEQAESGVGRWHAIRLATLSFYEYLQLKKANLPSLPSLKSLNQLLDWTPEQFQTVSQLSSAYTAHFHEYLIIGGFPQTAQLESVHQAQKLLREDIIDKVLKRDMTALFGVRRILELEQIFLYLCMHDGGLLDMTTLCSNLSIKRPTAQRFIELLQSAHLIYRLAPFGYGKDILRAKYKIYLADAAISSAVLLKGKKIIDDPMALGIATETAVFKHLFTRYYAQNIYFSYWQGNKNNEIDLLTSVENQLIPFEIKYRAQHTDDRELKGLIELCETKNIHHGYVVTKHSQDFGLEKKFSGTNTTIIKVPASLLCYWIGETELQLNTLSEI